MHAINVLIELSVNLNGMKNKRVSFAGFVSARFAPDVDLPALVIILIFETTLSQTGKPFFLINSSKNLCLSFCFFISSATAFNSGLTFSGRAKNFSICAETSGEGFSFVPLSNFLQPKKTMFKLK
jgi:hypothetical protein